ncbi:hypothetical protein FACS1894188_09350 [Clostridia bacterium]|nr:hypothetical protein FACS1894188_09350 [Clostridia bacterium]
MSGDKRLNEVIRVQKRPNSFITMDKGFVENPNLSWKAKTKSLLRQNSQRSTGKTYRGVE